jgi:hypothetical protein
MRKKAVFSQSRNDLLWEFFCCETIRWYGYNDPYWWCELSGRQEVKTGRCGKCGKVYELDFETGEVKEERK